MTDLERSWQETWRSFDTLSRASRNPRHALRFVEGGDARQAMTHAAFHLVNLCEKFPEVEREYYQSRIAGLWESEMEHMPIMGAA